MQDSTATPTPEATPTETAAVQPWLVIDPKSNWDTDRISSSSDTCEEALIEAARKAGDHGHAFIVAKIYAAVSPGGIE